MWNSEEAKDCYPEETSSPPPEQQQTGHVYPDWAAMQAYYGPRMAVPPYFSSAAASGHAPPPYMWGPLQHMVPPYATIYPHGGVYAHPGVTVASSPMHIDSPAKSSGNSDQGLTKKLKEFDGLAMSIGNDNGGSVEGGNDNGISQSGETEGSSEGSDGNTTVGAKNGRKRNCGGSSTSSEVGKSEQSNQLPSTNANGGSKKVTGLTVAPGKVFGKAIGEVISADSGSELQLKKFPDMTSAAVTMMPSTAILQNERELKRERRKQSNRESARRSRLRKQAEAEELGSKVESLTSENLTLKSEINRLTVNSANLKLQNAKLLVVEKKSYQSPQGHWRFVGLLLSSWLLTSGLLEVRASWFGRPWSSNKINNLSILWVERKMGHNEAVWDSKMAIETVKDHNGIDQIVLPNPQGASAKVSLQGGRVVSWRNDRGEELLFTSSKANGKPPKLMQGGIPICFPQFGNCASLEQHGFARRKIWVVEQNYPPLPANDSNGKSFVDLLLKPSKEDLRFWPHSFELRLRVCLGMDGNLTLISRVRNINGKPFSFSFAYHSYLSVSDIGEVRIEGLETMDYLDNLHHRERFTEQGDAITFESEFERVYLSSPNFVAVMDHERKRTYVVRKEGLPDVVVWNPWEKKAKAMVDLGDDEYRRMLCVDGAAIENPITLKPGQEWKGRLEIDVVPSSFCSDYV